MSDYEQKREESCFTAIRNIATEVGVASPESDSEIYLPSYLNSIHHSILNNLSQDFRSAFGDGYYDGFKAAQEIVKKEEDLLDYNEDIILMMSENAEAKAQLPQRKGTKKQQNDKLLGLIDSIVKNLEKDKEQNNKLIRKIKKEIREIKKV